MSEQIPTEKPTGLALLRVAFPPNQISKLPKPTCPNDEWKALPKANCKECGGYHATSRTIHLDYVGHAALTDRLLDADPMWNWEPVALDPDGLPKFDANGGMWIQLTVCGVTRLGYGDAAGKKGPNAVKEAIGDALRNAAMRFGAALDLWHKGELHAADDAPDPSADDVPEGYAVWLDDMTAAAGEGLAALEACYKSKATKQSYRDYLKARGGVDWLKDQAKAADAARRA